MTVTTQTLLASYPPNIQGALVALAASYTGGVLQDEMLDITVADYQAGDPGTIRQVNAYISPTEPTRTTQSSFTVPLVVVAIVLGFLVLAGVGKR